MVNKQNFLHTAYPIDGILQVEEEEEENNSDNETYTIEEDVRQRRKARAMARGSGDARKSKQSFPRPSRQTGARPKEAWTRPTDFSKWTRTNRKSKQEVTTRFLLYESIDLRDCFADLMSIFKI